MVDHYFLDALDAAWSGGLRNARGRTSHFAKKPSQSSADLDIPANNLLDSHRVR